AEFSHGGQWLAVGGESPGVWVYDVATAAPAFPSLPREGQPVRTVFSPDDKTLLVVTEGGEVSFWNLPTGTRRGLPGHHQGVVWSADFSPDGRYALTASSDRTARLWDVASAHPVRDFVLEKAVFTAAFSHDGRRIMTGSADHTARIWDRESGRPLSEAMHHPGDVWYATFSADDQRVLTGDDAGNARVWETASGLPLGDWVTNGHSLKQIRFRPDGRQALSASVDGIVRVWPVVMTAGRAPNWLPDLAEAIAGRRLRDDGTGEPVPNERLQELRRNLTSEDGDDFYHRWAHWFLVERMRDNPPPFKP
ncbi:MAG TPA: hypothetical protein VHI52_14015, partial [Verrucomicrobiae bacterium]|nr:hypothetical protein [Verrucomicrobiae bacterium]